MLFEGLYFTDDRAELARARLRQGLRRLRGTPRAHHRDYDAEMLARLPLVSGMTPEVLVDLVESSGWGPARLERLRDVEWTRLLALPPIERMLGACPHFVITAGSV